MALSYMPKLPHPPPWVVKQCTPITLLSPYLLSHAPPLLDLSIPSPEKLPHHCQPCTDLVKEVANGLGEPLFVTALDYLRPFEIPEADQLHHYKSFPKSLWLFPLSMHSCYAKCSKQYMQIALPSVEFFVLEFLGTSHGNIPVFLPRKVNTTQLPSNNFYLRTTPEHEWHPLSHCNNSHRGSSP